MKIIECLVQCNFSQKLNLLIFMFLKIFLTCTIFKVFIEFVTVLLLFYVLVFHSWGLWDLRSPTRHQTWTPCSEKQSLNQCTVREVPQYSLFSKEIKSSVKWGGRMRKVGWRDNNWCLKLWKLKKNRQKACQNSSWVIESYWFYTFTP